MAGTIGSYSTALSGMATMQTALSITTKNITNVDTQGYSRQSTIQSDTAWSSGYTGVRVQDIVQIRDRYVDEKYRNQLAAASAEETFLTYATEVESVLCDISDTGLEELIDPFFNAWEELAKNPDDASVRTTVYETALALTDALNEAGESLDTLQSNINDSLEDTVDRINELSVTIAELNVQIGSKTASGETPTDLLDTRNLLLDELCGLSGCSYYELEDNTVSVYLDQSLLVSGDTSFDITLEVEPISQQPALVWTESKNEISPKSGQIEGMLRAGQDGTVNEARSYLDSLANTIGQMVNASHESGYGLDGSTGVTFFTGASADGTFTANHITVNSDLENTDLIAAAAQDSDGDNTLALEIAALRDTTGIADQAQAMIDWISGVVNSSEVSQETNNLVLEQLETTRSSTMSVNLDEELTNLMLYQQAYNASAQVFQIIDELVDLVINGM